MKRRIACILLAAAMACASGSGGGYAERVGRADVEAFARRIDRFYGSIAQRPLDAYLTFQDPALRGYFGTEQEFSDYYASLANQIRRAHFQRAQAQEVRIEEFRFDAPDEARVDVVLLGRHERALRFWQIEVRRTDRWLHNGQVWVLAPEGF